MPGKPMDRHSSTPAGSRPGFDFTTHMRRLCSALVAALPELAHIQLDRVGIGFRQARRRGHAGVQATLTPLRFEGGNSVKLSRGRRLQIERIVDEHGREMLYLLNFYLPRFLEAPFEERLITVLHELWHINPAFDGDLRRFHGRCYAHSHSREGYDQQMSRLAARWLESQPPEEDLALLRQELALLQQQGPIWGMRFPVPKVRSVKVNAR